MRVRSVMVTGVLAGVASAGIAAAAPFAYVPNATGNSLSVIDTANNTVSATVGGLNAPFGVALHSNSNLAYIGEQGDPVAGTSAAAIAVLDTSTNAIGTRVTLASPPTGLAVNRAGTRLYVATVADEVRVYTATSTPSLVATIAVGDRPHGIAVLPNGTRAYVAQSLGIAVIDTGSNTVLTTIGSLATPTGVAAAPDSSRVYASAGTLNGSLLVVDPTSNTIVATVGVGRRPAGVGVIPGGSLQGTKVYVANEGDDTISVVSTATNTVTATLTGVGFVQPYGVAVNPAGTRAYVVNECPSGWFGTFCSTNLPSFVTVLDTSTDGGIASVTVGKEPFALGDFFIPPCFGCCN